LEWFEWNDLSGIVSTKYFILKWKGAVGGFG
jgi:hypothetical protein